MKLLKILLFLLLTPISYVLNGMIMEDPSTRIKIVVPPTETTKEDIKEAWEQIKSEGWQKWWEKNNIPQELRISIENLKIPQTYLLHKAIVEDDTARVKKLLETYGSDIVAQGYPETHTTDTLPLSHRTLIFGKWERGWNEDIEQLLNDYGARIYMHGTEVIEW